MFNYGREGWSSGGLGESKVGARGVGEMIVEMIRKDELVLWVLQIVCGGDGQQQRWWRTFPFASLTIFPFDEVLTNFNRWNQKRSENDED